MPSESYGSVTQRKAEMADLQPWDFQQSTPPGKRETAKAYRVFRVYLELGCNRTVKTAADIAGENPEVCRQFSSRYNWQARTAAYDAHMVSLWGQEVREEFETTHKKELMKFRKDQQRRAEKLGKVADLLIEVTTETLEDMVASGEPVDRNQLAAIATTAAKLSDAAMNTAAAALGVDDLMEAIAPDVD